MGFKNPKKPFKERYWFLIAAAAYVIGLLTPTIQESMKRKILPQSNQSTPTIPTSSDNHQNRALEEKKTE